MAPTTVLLCGISLLLVHAMQIVWRRLSSVLDNIPGPARQSLFTGIPYFLLVLSVVISSTTGNLTQYYDPEGWEFHKELEQNYGQVVKVHGLFGARQLYVFDPAALHSILIKDQDLYEETPVVISMNSLMFGKGIFSTIRDNHRKYRKIMLPAFSSANIRGMVPLFYEVAERVRDGLIAPNLKDGPQKLELNSIISRTSLELIGRAGIGYSFDSMLPGDKKVNRYAEALRGLTYEIHTAFKLSVLLPLLPYIVKLPFPSVRRFMINFIPLAALHQLRDLTDFTAGTAAQLVRDRKDAIKNGDLCIHDDSKDIMSLLIKSNMSTEGEMHLTDEELMGSLTMILAAATDTTSTSMTRVLEMLALYPEIQEKLRAEILAAPEYPDHDTVVALPYLDGFVREVLRLFPPAAPSMFREAYEDAILPLSTPITGVDGTMINSITVPKGTSIYIAISAANKNRRVWGEDALEFRPERWTNGKADAVIAKMSGIYGNTMTFIGGGRSCIGFKFAQLEIKTLLCVLLRAFKFSKPDPGIKWRVTGVVSTPYIGKQPGLPIVVERLG